MQPAEYEISCDLCDGCNLSWSEFCGEVWCHDCQKDTPGNSGIFDGPISIKLCQMMGLCFDKFDLETKKRLIMEETDEGVIWVPEKTDEVLPQTV